LVGNKPRRRSFVQAAITSQKPGAITSSPRSAAGDKTLTKGLLVLESLSASEGSRGISELALELSLTRSTVHRLLQTLSRCGYVTREAGTDRYLSSSKLWRLSRHNRPFEALRHLVRPLLNSVVEETGESAVFALIEDDDLVIIDQVETQNPVRVVFFSAGQSFAVNSVVAPGKALTALQLIALAGRSEADARCGVRRAQTRLGKRTSSVDARMAELTAIQKAGVAVSRGEWVGGVNAVAVPVSDASHRLGVLGVLSCFGPADRVTEASLQKFQKILSLKARELARLVRHAPTRIALADQRVRPPARPRSFRRTRDL
jgi:IclR family transcriptional regulator, KDG regulon repressor